MGLILCSECKNPVSEKAKTCPHCGAKVFKGTAWVAAALAVVFLLFLGSLRDGTKPLDANPSNKNASVVEVTTPLEVQSWHCYSDGYGYEYTEGRVKNISSEKINGAAVVASYYTKGGDLVTSDDAVIDYNPLMPGQTSSFKAISRGNPAIKRCEIGFKYIFGEAIGFSQKPKLIKP